MALIHKIAGAFRRRRVAYALVGGHAVALHGAVRGTVDLDFVLRWSAPNLQQAERALRDCGLVSRLPITPAEVFQFRDEYIRNRNLVAWNFYNPNSPDEQVDLVINYDLAKRKVKVVRTKEGPIRVLNIDDLIEMKRASGRDQDMQDILALEKLR
jgi:hypothetical protein